MSSPPARLVRGAVGSARGAARGAALRTSVPRRELRAEGAVALTFDDGPDPVFTPQVLAVLGEHEATATFFLVGRRVRRHPELARQIISAGHAVGSHSWSHPDAWELSWPRLAWDYRAGRHALEREGGRTVRLFRPPKGHVDATGALAMRACGLRPWLWTANPRDWEPGVTADALLERLAPLAGRDVVLLHDGIERPVAPEACDRSATVAALPAIIALARSRGLEMVGLDAFA